MNVATSFPALIELARTEQAATHITFSSYRAGVMWRGTGGRLSALSAFYQDCETRLWIMTDWIANTTGLDRPGDGFFPIGEAVGRQARLAGESEQRGRN